jgi:hypothetical protein
MAAKLASRSDRVFAKGITIARVATGSCWEGSVENRRSDAAFTSSGEVPALGTSPPGLTARDRSAS